MTVTEKKAYWVIPAGIKQVLYAQIRNINFQGRKSSRPEVSCFGRPSHSPSPGPDVAAPDDEEMPIIHWLCALLNLLFCLL